MAGQLLCLEKTGSASSDSLIAPLLFSGVLLGSREKASRKEAIVFRLRAVSDEAG